MHKHKHSCFIPVPGPIGPTGIDGASVTGQNVGLGSGAIFKDKTGTFINFRTLEATGSSLTGATNTYLTITTDTNVVDLAVNGTPFNVPDTLVARDGTGSFAAQSVTLYGNLILVQDPSTASAGVIYKDDAGTFIHNAGSQNMFAGLNAGNLAITGVGNSGFGYQSLTSNILGNDNTAVGTDALVNNNDGSDNTALGYLALSSNVSGRQNVAVGSLALAANEGVLNVAIGYESMVNSTASNNIAVGPFTLVNDQFGGNIAIGQFALNATVNSSNNIAIGTNALINNLNYDNIAIGNFAGATIITGTDNIYINADAAASDESDTIRIGTNQTTCYVAGITGVTTVNPAVPVFVATDWSIGIASSLRSVKENIKDIDVNTNRDMIKNLTPRTFNYIADKNKHQQYGFIVEEVHPSLVHHDAKGNPQTIYYQHIPILLTKEIQRLGDLTDQLTKQLNEQRKIIEDLTAWKNRTKKQSCKSYFY